MKTEEAADEHYEDNRSDSDIEISPSHVVGSRAASYARFGNVARAQLWIARIFVTAKEPPSD